MPSAPMVRTLHRRASRRLALGPSFAVSTPAGETHVLGGEEPAFTLVARDRAGLAALASFDAYAIALAYVRGHLDVEGDFERALSLRDVFRDRHPFRFAWRFLRPLLFGQARSDRRWIAEHYDQDEEFFLSFLDERHRCYSHGVFLHADEPLADAITRKLDYALEAVNARPGDRILDIGGGWGAMVEHAGRRGVQVVSLTISAASERFVSGLIREQGLPCRIVREHLFEHRPEAPYDAIVNLGVTEHLPDYRGTLRVYDRLLKPGGRIYLDASATRRKHSHSAFLERHVYPGNGSLLCLHEYLAEVARTPFRLLAVHDDRLSYGYTTRAWAANLDRHREAVERRWGPELYRTFRLYLWGCADAFQRDLTQAYRWVLEKP